MNSSAENPAPDAVLTAPPWGGAPAPRFALGQLLSTPGALQLMQDNDVEPMALLQRHVQGDWGTVCAQDAQSNEEALACGARVMSSYLLPGGGVIWIITEADRSTTTCLRPDEY
ncbi:MAG: type I restriction endonuclease subunit M [Pseudomonadota bacterium]